MSEAVVGVGIGRTYGPGPNLKIPSCTGFRPSSHGTKRGCVADGSRHIGQMLRQIPAGRGRTGHPGARGMLFVVQTDGPVSSKTRRFHLEAGIPGSVTPSPRSGAAGPRRCRPGTALARGPRRRHGVSRRDSGSDGSSPSTNSSKAGRTRSNDPWGAEAVTIRASPGSSTMNACSCSSVRSFT